MLFTSGQIPIIPETGEIAQGDITVQAEQVMKNLNAVLEASGTEFKNVVKQLASLLIWLILQHLMLFIEKYFVGKPARSCVAVKQLPKNVLCEVELIAVVAE